MIYLIKKIISKIQTKLNHSRPRCGSCMEKNIECWGCTRLNLRFIMRYREFRKFEDELRNKKI
jgi:hypothetical protein